MKTAVSTPFARDENGPRRKDWGYGTLNRRMLLMVIAGPPIRARKIQTEGVTSVGQ